MLYILWFYLPAVILGVVYTGVAALYACAGEGGCWSGVEQTLPISAMLAGLAYLQVFPGILLGLDAGFHISRRDQAWKGFIDLGWSKRIAFVVYYGAVNLITPALSMGGLLALRACALKECYPRLSAHEALAIFLCGQPINLLIIAEKMAFLFLSILFLMGPRWG
jgi:hypothetical protein